MYTQPNTNSVTNVTTTTLALRVPTSFKNSKLAAYEFTVSLSVNFPNTYYLVLEPCYFFAVRAQELFLAWLGKCKKCTYHWLWVALHRSTGVTFRFQV